MKKEYYIQGDPARAEEIKAAFQELGINVLNFGFADKAVVYCSIGECVQYLPYSINLMNILYSHPAYMELPLPVKPNPKFKIGDWLWHKAKGILPLMVEDYDEKEGYLMLMQYPESKCYFGRDIIENEYRLWEISDAKDGDVLVDKYGNVGIYEGMSGLWWYSHIYFGCDGHLHGFEADGCHIQKNTKPATSEQRDLLFVKMRESGYQWDADKKELKKIPKHYDIANFHEGMPVLVREYDTCVWQWVLYSHFNGVDTFGVFFAAGKTWHQCIPFNDKTKLLLGTTDMPSEEFINW